MRKEFFVLIYCISTYPIGLIYGYIYGGAFLCDSRMRQSIHEDGPTLSRQHSSSPESDRVRSSSKHSGGSLSPASSISLVSLKLSALSTSSLTSSSSSSTTAGNNSAATKPAVNKSTHFSSHHHHSSSTKASNGVGGGGAGGNMLTNKTTSTSILQKHHLQHHRAGSLKSLHSSTSSSSAPLSKRTADNKNHLMGLDDFDIIKTIGEFPLSSIPASPLPHLRGMLYP